MLPHQERIDFIKAIIDETKRLEEQHGMTPEEELDFLLDLQVKEIEALEMEKIERKEFRKANALHKRISRSFKAAVDAFTVVEPETDTETE